MGAHPKEQDRVLVTGFGPFGVHKVNASWVAVQELEALGLDDPFVDLVVKEISVDYEYVKSKVPQLWESVEPLLVVHVGVSGMANAITLERCGHNSGYMKLDVRGKCPETGCCVDGEVPEHRGCLETGFDLQEVCRQFSEELDKIKIEISSNAGRYLCEFIYYSSLSIDNSRCLFVHVPDLNVADGKTLGAALKLVVDLLVKQVRVRETERHSVDQLQQVAE